MSGTAANTRISINHHFSVNFLKNKQESGRQERGGGKYLGHFPFSYLLGESTAGVKLPATCHKEQVYFSGMFGNPGKCEARLFGQAGLRAGLATGLPGGLSSPAAPLSVEGK